MSAIHNAIRQSRRENRIVHVSITANELDALIIEADDYARETMADGVVIDAWGDRWRIAATIIDR